MKRNNINLPITKESDVMKTATKTTRDEEESSEESEEQLEDNVGGKHKEVFTLQAPTHGVKHEEIELFHHDVNFCQVFFLHSCLLQLGNSSLKSISTK